MRKLIAIAAAALLLALAGAGAAGSATRGVRVEDNYFARGTTVLGTLNVRRNDIVKWTWYGEDPHNVYIKEMRRRSPVQTTGTYRKRFRTRGRFTVICEIHPNTMRMRVRVR